MAPTASHPFWARPFPDVAIVHNGQITNDYLLRDRLRRKGYRFMTENDSELIAVWIFDRMSKGADKLTALDQSKSEMDGMFTYLIADTDSIGFARDKWAIRPLVSMGGRPEVAVATEEQAVRRIYLEKGDVNNHALAFKTGQVLVNAGTSWWAESGAGSTWQRPWPWAQTPS